MKSTKTQIDIKLCLAQSKNEPGAKIIMPGAK
jgi:hypothetical protein